MTFIDKLLSFTYADGQWSCLSDKDLTFQLRQLRKPVFPILFKIRLTSVIPVVWLLLFCWMNKYGVKSFFSTPALKLTLH